MTTQPTDSVRYWAVVPAAGAGKRMRSHTPKQYLTIGGKTLLQLTLERLLSVPSLAGIMVALGAEDAYWSELVPARQDSRILTTTGGVERADSVLNALEALTPWADDNDWVLVHDAARLCITREDVEKLISGVPDDAIGGILAVPVTDTLKHVRNGNIIDTPDRSHIWRALTPQMFRLGNLREALVQARKLGHIVTDDASALELQGQQPLIIEGRPDNIKVTQPEDLALAAFYLEQQCYV